MTSGLSRLKGFQSWPLVLSAAGALLVIAAWTLLSAPPAPRFSVRFTGSTTAGIHLHPRGRFILTNESKTVLNWQCGAAVEAPADRALWFSAAVVSTIPMGTLPGGESTNFHILVPRAKDVPFRVLVHYSSEHGALDRLRKKVPILRPFIDRIQPMEPSLTYTSQWFRTTVDYENPVPSLSGIRNASNSAE